MSQNCIMPRKRPPLPPSVMLPLKKTTTTQPPPSHHSILDASPLNCPYPLCIRHSKPFKRPQDCLRHLSTNDCISKMQSYYRTQSTFSPATMTDDIGPSTTVLNKFNLHVNNISTTYNYTTQTQADIIHPSIIQQHATMNYYEEDSSVEQYNTHDDNAPYDADSEDNNTLSTFTTNQKCIVSLMRILDNMNAPDYALEAILKWARNSHAQRFDFNPPASTRNANLKWMRKFIKNSNMLLPKTHHIQLEDTTTVQVVTFDFVAHLLSLLHDTTLMQWDNLALNPDDPFAP